MALEGAAIRTPIRNTECLEQMEETVEFMRKANSSVTRAELVRADLSFHQWMVMSADNERLTHVYGIAQSDILLSMVQSQHVIGHKHIASEHARILRALQAQDTELAIRERRAHLGTAVSRMAADWMKTPFRNDSAADLGIRAAGRYIPRLHSGTPFRNVNT